MAFLQPCPIFKHSLRTSSQPRRQRTTYSTRPYPPRALADDLQEDRPVQNASAKTPLQLKAREVSADQLEVVLKENERPLLVDAYAKWCGPCQFLSPQLDIVAQRYADRLDVLKLDTEMYPDLASALLIRGLPTLFFIKDGKLRYRMEGALSAEQLEELIDYVLFEGPPPKGAIPQDQPMQQDD